MPSDIVLIIDDDKDDREIFIQALSEVNPAFTCKEAFDGIDALEQLQKTILLPDLIFLDVNMPRMGGFECLKEIKQIPLIKEIPVIIYSTAKNHELELKAFKNGAACFIQKPFQYNEIINCIKTIMTEYLN